MAGPYINWNTSRVFTNDSGSLNPILTVFYISTSILALVQALILIFATVSTSKLSEKYIDKDLEKATKLALKSFVKSQKHDQLKANFTL